MDYAVIRLGGRQFTVTEGTKIKLVRQQNPVAEVVLVSQNGNVVVGTPTLSDYRVEFGKIEEARDDKVRIGRFRAKSRHRRVKGHKQPISIIEIKGIVKGGKKVEQTTERPTEVKKEKAAAKQVKVAAPKKKVTKVDEAPKKRGRPKKVQE